MTEREVGEVLALIYAAYPRERSSEQTIQVFVAGLVDMDAAPVREAAQDWVREQRWPPSLADLRTKAQDIQAQERARAETERRLLPPGCPTGDAERKAKLQIANIQAWLRGEIDTAAMIRRSATIYADDPPCPVDGLEVVAEAEDGIERLRGTPGPLAPTIQRGARTVAVHH